MKIFDKVGRTAVSMTPLCTRCDENRQFHSRLTPQIRSHIQKGFNPCIRGLWGVRKSRVPLNHQTCGKCMFGAACALWPHHPWLRFKRAKHQRWLYDVLLFPCVVPVCLFNADNLVYNFQLQNCSHSTVRCIYYCKYFNYYYNIVI
jgi:hypothetical protein